MTEDWQGNKIRIGDIILVYNFMDMFGGQKMALEQYDRNRKLVLSERFIADYDFKWELDSKYKITNKDIITISIDPDFIQQIPIQSADTFIANQPWQAACIKGLSDDKQSFMESYFNK